jgi:hypothetical protein
MELFKEQKRLAAVQKYLSFNSDRQNDLKDIVMLASVICHTPIALITLMDRDMQVIKARVGINAETLPRNSSFCTHAIERGNDGNRCKQRRPVCGNTFGSR